MVCSSPRARAGLSRLPASIDPSALPAPTTVCNSSMKRMIFPSLLTTSLMTALSRSSNSPRNLVPAINAPMSRAMIFLFCKTAGTSPLSIADRQALDDGGFADARLADEHRIILGAA